MTTSISGILKYLSTNNLNIMNQKNDEMPTRAKKRRLDHLTWEEKLQRKKLKNRVAAQTSRDRKKQKMEQMENALQELFAKNEALVKECENLRLINERLTEENAELKSQLSAPCVYCSQNRSGECEAQSGSTESLLRPKGTVTHSAAALDNKKAQVALLKMLLAFLLYQTYSTNSTSILTSMVPFKLSSKISPETWKRVLRQQIIKNQSLIDKRFLTKWWGRHQNNWNPVEVK